MLWRGSLTVTSTITSTNTIAIISMITDVLFTFYYNYHYYYYISMNTFLLLREAEQRPGEPVFRGAVRNVAALSEP